jgi:hypothetical protein
VRNSSLVKWSGADNVTGLKSETEATDFALCGVVGERSQVSEAAAEAAVESWEVRMLARVTKEE